MMKTILNNRRFSILSCLSMARMLVIAFLVVGVHSQAASAKEEARPAPDADYEFVLDLWPSQGGKHPVRIAIRNVGSQKMSSEQCMKIFARCVLHISKPDASRSSRALGSWRGRAPDDISRGDLASHCVRSPVASLFKMEKAGRYILWWTDGNKRSNPVVFERTETGLERLP